MPRNHSLSAEIALLVDAAVNSTGSVLREINRLGERDRKFDLLPVRGQAFASHQLDRRPILSKEAARPTLNQ